MDAIPSACDEAAIRTIKRKILIATIDGGGNLPPLLAIAGKLIDSGHSVRVLAEPSSRQDVEATGAIFVSWTRAPHRLSRIPGEDLVRDWAEADPAAGARHVIDKLICGAAQAFADDVVEELDRSRPDIVLALDMLLGVLIACERYSQRVAVLAPNLPMFPVPGLPSFGTGLPAARNEDSRKLHAEISKAVMGLFDTGLPSLNAARTNHRLPPLHHVFDQIAKADAIWLLTSRAFDFDVPELPKGVSYVGPQTADPAWAGAWDSPWPADDPRPLVLVSLSTSFQNQADTINRIILALSHLAVRAVVTLGPQIRGISIVAADNVQVVPQASHERLMPLASLVVTHGGHGTVIRALRYRLPLLILPHGRDQADNAIRIVDRGAGLSLDRSASPKEIRGAVEQLLNDSRFLLAARDLGDKVAQEAERSDIVLCIEMLTARNSQS